MTPETIQLMREHDMKGDCNYCGKPVRASVKYCDPFCTYQQIAKNKAGKESGNEPSN